MLRSALRLGAWLGVVFFIEAIQPRLTPPGGLVPFDYYVMCLVPLGAIHAAFRAPAPGWLFLLYGGLGAMLFVPGYLANGRLGLAIAFGNAEIAAIIWGWLGFVLGMSVCCRLIGAARWVPGLWDSLRHRKARRRAAQGLCAACGYDLRASIERCPECGKPIPLSACPEDLLQPGVSDQHSPDEGR